MARRSIAIQIALATSAVAVGVLYACAGEDLAGPERARRSPSVEAGLTGMPATSPSPEGDLTPARICGEPTVTSLLAGRDEIVGHVSVSNDEDELAVIYRLDGGWELREIHLSVTGEVASIPTTRSGNPKPGRFAHQDTYERGTTSARVDLSLDMLEAGVGDRLVVAAHAEVVHPGDPSDPEDDRKAGAWADGERIHEPGGGSWATYFETTVSDCATVSQRIGPDGGSVVARDVVLDIPAGAIEDDVRITVEPTKLDDLSNDLTDEERETILGGTVVDLGPDGLTFDEPVALTLSYDEAEVDDGLNETRLRLATIDDRIAPLLPSTVDTDANHVTASVEHFTFFFVLKPIFLTLGPRVEEDIAVSDSVTVQMDADLGTQEVVVVADAVDVTLAPDVTASEAITVSDAVTIDVTAANLPPTATITAPMDGASFTEGDPVAFEGSGSDPEDGTLAGASLVWTSDLDGELGTGISVTTSSLSVGTQTIVLTASDADGATGTASISVTIDPAPSGGPWRAVSAGRSYTCAVTSTQEAFCWGRNSEDQGGNGQAVMYAPTPVAGDIFFASVDAGDRHTCGASTGGQGWCWGTDSSGALGDGTSTGASTPVAVVGGMSFAEVAAGSTHSCGRTAAGSLYCWGNNDQGQLGDGTLTSSSTPVAVLGDLAARELSVGIGSSSCVVTDLEEAWCWGRGDDGQLGNGFAANYSTPVRVAGGQTWQTVSVATYHGCGVTTAGEGYCWGSNTHGRLGTGNEIDSERPVLVSGGHTFKDISAGREHSCGVTTEGVVLCWGRNTAGQLGDGTTTDSSVPVAVALPSTASDFVSVSAGETHTCALTTGGAIYCWGIASSLGDGTTFETSTSFSTVPILVTNP